jgi:regulator of extracellular matrix RemA (YlzA/DUF370 family)
MQMIAQYDEQTFAVFISQEAEVILLAVVDTVVNRKTSKSVFMCKI